MKTFVLVINYVYAILLAIGTAALLIEENYTTSTLLATLFLVALCAINLVFIHSSEVVEE